MNRKERAWQGSEASLSILTRETAVVELFKILKSNRLSPCKCHFKLPLYFPRNSSSPSSSFFSPTENRYATLREFSSEEISLSFCFLPLSNSRRIARLFSLANEDRLATLFIFSSSFYLGFM